MDKSMLEQQLVDILTKGLSTPKVSAVGCGGAGNNIIHSIYCNHETDVETIAVNTDKEKMKNIEAHKKALIGKDITDGSDAGGSPEIGRCCAENAEEALEELLDESEIVFVIAGMGGGSGTGIAPVVTRVAKRLGAVTFAIAIKPFSHEGTRCKLAEEGIENLRSVTDTTIVLDNDRLLEIAGDLRISEAFSVMEKSIVKIIESVNTKINQSFIAQIEEDVRDMIKEYGEEGIRNLQTRVPRPKPTMNLRAGALPTFDHG